MGPRGYWLAGAAGVRPLRRLRSSPTDAPPNYAMLIPAMPGAVGFLAENQAGFAAFLQLRDAELNMHASARTKDSFLTRQKLGRIRPKIFRMSIWLFTTLNK